MEMILNKESEVVRPSFFEKITIIFEIIGYKRASAELRRQGYSQYANNLDIMCAEKQKELS